jgi:hypothetical protein
MRLSASGFFFHKPASYGLSHTLNFFGMYFFGFKFKEVFEFESFSAGSDTTQKFVQRGIRPPGLFRVV